MGIYYIIYHAVAVVTLYPEDCVDTVKNIYQSFGKALSLLPRAYAFTTAVLPPNIRSSNDCLFFRRTLNTSLHTSRNTSAICPTCSAAATSVKQHSKSFANISPIAPQEYNNYISQLYINHLNYSNIVIIIYIVRCVPIDSIFSFLFRIP